MTLHLHGPQDATVKFHPAGSQRFQATPYGFVVLDGTGANLTLFVEDRDQALAIAAAFENLAARFADDAVPAEMADTNA